MENATILQQQDDKKAKTLVTAVNHESNRQPYVTSGSMEITASVPIKPEATKLKTVQALLDLGADDDHMDPDILPSWWNAASHNKNMGKCYDGLMIVFRTMNE